MKNKFLNSFIIITLILFAFIVYNKFKLSENSHLTVTADTVIKPGSKISKYVTQEEVDSFSFRYSDIHCDKETNSTLIPLRKALMDKDTNKVLNFIKDNNLSADVTMLDKRTPLMYSSFYNDTNTTKELIKLGADVHKKDRYKLNALAYAISINSANTVKILLDNNLTVEETPVVQMYGSKTNFYRQLDKIIINGDDIEMIYSKELTLFKCGEGRYGDGLDPFLYVVRSNLYDTAKVILESGYIPTKCKSNSNKYGADCYDNISKYENYEPMLNLLLKHNVSGQPSKELMKKVHDECYNDYNIFLATKNKFLKGDLNLILEEKISLNGTLKTYEKYCNKPNSNFLNTKSYISWKNNYNKNYELYGFLMANKDDKSKVIYLDKNQNKSGN
ncbi:ankyrin repeat domain-containing protein [Campylobacter ureolyticus]|uniref:ankyrin repeat domain-containing protein n=1 Tax=Campylobacter ureolyticus TaxID=827 RepID=UPI0022B5BE42|nr:ankyrin repeat domain-containing protein [Campylobacter ureolyticus]MCZ6156727.1 ankyrin repeat domain-containing protein [Campylobacter ureolyticus]